MDPVTIKWHKKKKVHGSEGKKKASIKSIIQYHLYKSKINTHTQKHVF